MDSSIVIKAWRDRKFLESLSEEMRSQLPASPVGEIRISREALDRFDYNPTMVGCTIAFCLDSAEPTRA